MTNSYAPIPLETLLSHAGWAHRLARSLTRDFDEADDVVQETWIVSARQPPDQRGPVEPWLATVLRRMAGRYARDRRARSLREQHANTFEEPVSPETLSLRAEAHKKLAGAVEQLEESLRTTILLRFYEGMSCADISRVQCVPAGTVRWRLKRALEILRAAMSDGDTSDRGSWKALLLPLLPENETLRPPQRTPSLPGWHSSFVLPMLGMGLGALALAVYLGGREVDSPRGMTSSIKSDPSPGRGNPPPAKFALQNSLSCDGIAHLRDQVRKAEAEAVKAMRPDTLFAYAPTANPIAEAALGPLVAKIMKGDFDEPESYTFECHQWACLMLVLHRMPVDHDRVNAWMQPLQRSPEIRSRTSGITYQDAGAVRDPLSGEVVAQDKVFIALARADGTGATSESQKRLYVSTFVTLPPGECASETQALRTRLRVLGLDANGLVLSQRFDKEPPNSELEKVVAKQLALVFPSERGAQAECRGAICRLFGPASEDSGDLHKSDWFRRHMASGLFGSMGSFIKIKTSDQVAAEAELVAVLKDLARSPRLTNACQRPGDRPDEFSIAINGSLADGLSPTYSGKAAGSRFHTCAANLITEAIDAFARGLRSDIEISTGLQFKPSISTQSPRR